MVRISSLITVLVSVFSGLAFADNDSAVLDNENSAVSFVSTKNKDIAEVIYFERISGEISELGAVLISIDATSVNSAIEIRDGRMVEHLFDAVNFPTIDISAQVALDDLGDEPMRMQLPATLSILGRQHQIALDLIVAEYDEVISVASAKPVLVNAAQLGLDSGVAKLAELAGGIAIGATVPVSFVLSFDLDD